MNCLIKPVALLLLLSLRAREPASAQANAAQHAAAAPSRSPTAEEQFKTALKAQQQGNCRQAIRIYRSLLKAHPDSLPVRVNLAGLLVKADQFPEAIDLYRNGLRLTPSSKELQLGLAYALGRQGTPEGLALAAKALEMLQNSDPTDDQASMLLADSYVRQARYTEAMPLLTSLEAAHPDDPDIEWLAGFAMLAVGQTEEGLKRIDSVATHTGNAEAYLLAGQTRLELQQFDLAKADAVEATTRNPNLPGAQTLLGRALEHTGDYDGSVAALRKAVALDDADFDAHLYLGAVLLFQRDLPSAEKELRRALTLRPDSAEARYKLALLEQAQGKNADALQDLHAVIEQRKDWLEPRTTEVALLYKLHRNEEAAAAKEAADKLAAAVQLGAPK